MMPRPKGLTMTYPSRESFAKSGLDNSKNGLRLASRRRIPTGFCRIVDISRTTRPMSRNEMVLRSLTHILLSLLDLQEVWMGFDGS